VRAYTLLHDVGEWDSGEAASLEEDDRILTLEEFRNLARSMDGVHVSNRLGTETLVVVRGHGKPGLARSWPCHVATSA
jgi:hypothetical protein